MSFQEKFRKDIEAFPAALQTLIEAELAAGNEVVEIGHSFPAPPAGAYIKLAKTVRTRPRKSGNGLEFYDRNSSIYSGEFTDANRFFFILEPPHPQEPEPQSEHTSLSRFPSGQALRKPKITTQTPSSPGAPTSPPAKSKPEAETPLERFKRSMIIDYEKWHDGVGYDLNALRSASAEELAAIEMLLIVSGANDWRDVEALAALGTPRARKALKSALKSSDHRVRLAVTEYAPELTPDAKRAASLVTALENADFYGGLTQALEQVEEFHPPEVVEALFRGALEREGEIAVHFAALLMFVHGKALEPFDWEQRPFFLKFNTDDHVQRRAAFRELCEKLGNDASRRSGM